MLEIRNYLIEIVLDNIKENIKVYTNNNDKYFKELINMTENINKDNSLIKYFNENTKPLMLITEEIIKDIKEIPYIYDLRDGL